MVGRSTAGLAPAAEAGKTSMATEIVPFAPEHHERVARFSAQVWPRPRTDAFLRWRYRAPAFHRGYLALRDGSCLAMLSVFRRPYRAGDGIVHVADSFDWFTLPELQKSGLGVRLMQRLMKDPDPVIVTGGSPDTRALLPKMGFRTLDRVRRYWLPIGADRVASLLAERSVPRSFSRLAFRVARHWVGPRRLQAPAGGRAFAVAGVGEEAHNIDPRPGARGCAPVWTPEFLAWLQLGFPGMGHYLPLYYGVGERLVGWALLRIFEGAEGCEAHLLDVRAREDDAALYAWMVSEAVARAAGLGAGLLTTGTTLPALEQALRDNRFRQAESAPIHCYGGESEGLAAPIVFGAHWGDEPLVPYPSRAW
jgi:hypothetical protein